jgi:hypothetical protein
MEVFPADEFTDAQVKAMIGELIAASLLEQYDVSGATFWRVTGWKHQKIDQPTYKHPLPNGSIPETPDKRRTLAVATPNVRRTHAEATPPDVDVDLERKGKEKASPLLYEDIKPSEAAIRYLKHDEICIPVNRFEIEETGAGIEAIMAQEKLGCAAALDWLMARAREHERIKGKRVGPGWVRKMGYNETSKAKIPPMVSAVEEKRRQMREVGD